MKIALIFFRSLTRPCCGVPLLLAAAICAAPAATLTVTSTADNGAGSLRAALASASSGDTIDATGVSGTILLTSGELLVTNSLNILGPGPANLAANGNAASRVFYIGTNTIVSISGLTITNGAAFPVQSGGSSAGGGIYNDHATLTVSNCTLSVNSADYGAGIYNDGFNDGVVSNTMLTVYNSILIGNKALFGGGIENDGSGDVYDGNATLIVSNCIFSGNSVSGGNPGIDNNGGAGIHNDGRNNGNATLVIVGSTLKDNFANAQGAIESDGGGIYNDGLEGSATLTISNCTFSGNSASRGGGLFNDARYGGNATMKIVTSTVNGNSASTDGGGIENNGFNYGSAALLIANSTISSNAAMNSFGAGGGIYNDGAQGSMGGVTLEIRNVTFSGNSAFSGGGIENGGGTPSSATLVVGSTILNAGAAGANIVNDSDSTVTSLGYNLSSDVGGGYLTGTADQINIDPRLGPLQSNGGPTFTHALLPGSPAIDQGKNFSGSATDQRGQVRIYDNPAIPNSNGGDGTDIGAFEFVPPTLTITYAGNLAIVSWPSPSTGFTPQTNGNFATGTWVNYGGIVGDNGTIKTVTNAPPTGTLFFRLKK